MYQSREKFFKFISFVFFLKECDWLSEHDKIEGFEWRGGSERVTSGIQIWSKPFVCENKFGEKVRFTNLVLDSYTYWSIFP